MNEKLARRLIIAIKESCNQLMQLGPVIKAECDEEEYKRLAYGIGEIAIAINNTLLNVIFKSHPALEKELGESVPRE